MPTLRVPLAASAWLGTPTNCTATARAKYPNLGQQYQTLIKNLVTRFTKEEIVVILDLHWNSDDIEQSEMALRSLTDDKILHTLTP